MLFRSKTHYKSSIYDITEDSEGKEWLGSRGGGLCIDGRWYKSNSEDTTSISKDHIFKIYRDTKDRMWIGTFGGGLNLALKENGNYSFRHFFNDTYTQGHIRAIVQDKHERMWIGTNDGIYVFNPDSLIKDEIKYTVYNISNGLLKADEIKSIILDTKDRIWIGTSGAGDRKSVV